MQPALRLEHLAGLRDQALIDFQARGPGVERGVGLVVGHLRLQHLSVGDVRGIRYHSVEVRAVDGRQQIRLQEPHPLQHPMPLRIAARDLERRRRKIHRRHLGSRQGMRKRNRDRARAGAHVNDARVRFAAERAPAAASTRCSVSGRGMRTSGVTSKSRPKNSCAPVMYCIGSQARRRLSKLSN